MANNNHKIKVELDFSADTKAAKSAIQELSKSLNSISEGKFSGIGDVLAKDLQEGQKAAAQLKAILNESFNVDTGKLDLGRFQQAMKKANTNLNSLRYNLQGLGPVGVDTFINLSRSITMAEIPVFRLNDKIKKLGATFANTMRWQISSSVLNMMVGAVQNAFQYAQDLNESLTNIRIVTGYNAEAMDEFASHANKAAKALSTTTNEYAKASLIYFQQGLNDAEVEKRTATTIKLANVTGESAETVSEWMTAVWNNFDDGSKALEHYADVMTALGAATASSSDEIAGGLEKFAAIAKTIGLSYEYAASALATVTAVTRQSEDVVGTAFKTIFGRMEGLELGQTLDDGVTLNKYSEALSSVGVQILDVNGELKDMDTILNDLGGRWDSLSQGQKVALAQVVGGMRQYNQLIALMDNWEYFQENLTTATNSSGELNRQADIYAESWQAASDKVQATLEEMYNKLLNDDTFVDLINGFADFLELINDAIDSIGGLKGVLFALGAVLTSVFSDKIIKSLSTMSLNFQTMTKKGRERIQQMKQEAYDQSAQSIHDSSPAMSARITAVVQESKLEDAFQKKLSKQSEIQQAIYRAEIETLKVRMKKNTELGESVDLLKKEADQQKKNFQKALTNSSYKSFRTLGSALENFDGSGTENAKVKNEDILKDLEGISNKNKIAKKTVKELQDTLNAGTLSIEQFEKGIQKIYGALSKDLSKSDRYKDEVKEIDAALDNATNATNDYIQANKELEAELEKTAQATNDLEQKMNDLKLPPLTWEEKLVGIANAAMQAGMAISALSSIGDTLTNDELSGWEKLEQILMSLSMLVPSLVSIFKAFNSERWEQVTTTWAQVAAEAALKKVQGNGDLDLKNNFRKNEDGSWDFITKDKKGKQTASRVTDKTQLDQLNKGEYSNIKLTKNQSGQVFGGGKIGNFKAAFKGGAGKMMGGAALITAGIAVAAGTIYGAYKFINKEKEEAQRAEKHARALGEALSTAKQKYEELKMSISSYKDGVDGLKQLTRGTLEYSEAIAKANDEALKMIKNNPTLKYSYNNEGLIEIDEDSLEQIREQEFLKTQKLQAATLTAEAEAAKQKQEVAQQDYLRQTGQRWGSTGLGAGVGLAGGLASGALIGAGIGTLGGPIGWVAGAIIGGIVGVVSGAITGAVTGEATSREEQAMEALYQKYSDMVDKGQDTSILNTKQGIEEALKEAGFGDMADALTKDINATYELVQSNYQMIKAQELATKAEIEAANSDKKAYTDSLYKTAIQNRTAQNIKNKDGKYQELYDANVDKLLKEGTYLNRNLWNTYITDVLGGVAEKEEEGAYRFRDRGGDVATLERYNSSAGKWEEVSELHENDALAAITDKQRANLSDDEIAKMEEEFTKQSKALYDAGIKGLQERIALIEEAADTKDGSLKDLSDFDMDQIIKIREAGFNVDKALDDRKKDIKDIKETLLGKLEQQAFDQITKNLDTLSTDQIRAISEAVINTMDKAGPEALANLTTFLSGYGEEEQQKLIEILEGIDWTAPGALEQFITQVENVEDLDIDIDKNNPALQSFSDAMIKAALEAESLASKVESMTNRISTALNVLKDKDIGDIVSVEDYDKLINEYPHLANNFIRTIEGYQLIISGEQQQRGILKTEIQNSQKIVTFAKQARNEFEDAYENKDLVSTVAGINNLSFEEQRQKYADLINSGAITDTMLGALGENAYNVVNSKSEEDLRAFTNKLQKAIDSQGVSAIDDTINVNIDAFRKLYPKASREMIENFLHTFDLTTEEIEEYLQNWDMDIKLDEWDYFLENVLNGREMEHSKENLADLQNSFSKLNNYAFTSAELMANLSDQMGELNNRMQMLSTAAPDILSFEELANLSEEKRWGYYDTLKTYESSLEEVKESLEEVDRQMADSVLKAFQDWNEEFDKINSKADYLSSVIDSYKSIVSLTRGFTDIDRKVLQSLDEAAVKASETKMINAKNNYEALLASKAKVEDEIRAAAANDIGGNKQYWEKQLDEINSMIDEAHADYLDSWKTTLEAAQDMYKNTIEEMFREFEKEMTGSFGSYDAMLEYYEQQKKLSKLYLADYEKVYELSKLTRNIEQSIDETDSLKAKAELRKLQSQINILQEDDTKMTEYQLEYLQKQYDLKLAEIALEEAQNAKHQVRLQRTASGSWGYVYTADSDKIDEAQQNYEDKIFELQQLNAEYIEQMTDLYLQLEGEFVDKLKEIYLATDLTEEEREEAITNANAFYKESMEFYLGELNQAVADSAVIYTDDALKYHDNISAKTKDNLNWYNDFKANVVDGTTKGFGSIEDRFQKFNEKLGSMGIGAEKMGDEKTLFGALEKAYEDYHSESERILGLAGSDFNTLGQTIDNVINGYSDDKGEHLGIVDQLGSLQEESDKVFGDMGTDISDLEGQLQNYIPKIATQYDNLITKLIQVQEQANNTYNELLRLHAEESGEDYSEAAMITKAAAQAKQIREAVYKNYEEAIKAQKAGKSDKEVADILYGDANNLDAWVSEEAKLEEAKDWLKDIGKEKNNGKQKVTVEKQWGNKGVNVSKSYNSFGEEQKHSNVKALYYDDGSFRGYYHTDALNNTGNGYYSVIDEEGAVNGSNMYRYRITLTDEYGSTDSFGSNKKLNEILLKDIPTPVRNIIMLDYMSEQSFKPDEPVVYGTSLTNLKDGIYYSQELTGRGYHDFNVYDDKGNKLTLQSNKYMIFPKSWDINSNTTLQDFNDIFSQTRLASSNLNLKGFSLTSAFNTGGYTGAWGPEGRWAMLHQKEIVLNATDTENFLSAIGILRSIVEMIDLRAATNAFNSSTLRAQNISTQSQILEQQVTIHAEFPNVIDHYEIETALNDIVNSASQYANRKI